MASRLKSDFRTAGDATRFGGQPPSFYLDASNFTGTNGLTINAGGLGAGNVVTVTGTQAVSPLNITTGIASDIINGGTNPQSSSPLILSNACRTPLLAAP